MTTIRPVDGSDPVDVGALARVVREAFTARPVLDPPAPALSETIESLTDSLRREGGLLATDDAGEAVAGLVFADAGPLLGLTRVAVLPGRQGGGLARGLVTAAEATARSRGYDGVGLSARVELPETVTFWERQGYVVLERVQHRLMLARLFPHEVVLPTADDTRALGQRLATLLRPGDLVVLVGDLGAGKTTFTQGLGAGLHVRGAVTSPTFVLARVHPPTGEGRWPLVHVDAYRLGGLDELDDLDLDTDLDSAVTVVEWGTGLAERLAPHRLEVRLSRPRGTEGAEGSETRHAVVAPVGARWVGERVADVLA